VGDRLGAETPGCRPVEPDRAEIALACWHVYKDTARYFGDNPPNEAETELRPDGTAITVPLPAT
jgi:hypothetical protein